jgi:hypothetical protein
MINDAGKHEVKSRRTPAATDAIRATLLLPRIRCFAEDDFSHVSNFFYAAARSRAGHRLLRARSALSRDDAGGMMGGHA